MTQIRTNQPSQLHRPARGQHLLVVPRSLGLCSLALLVGVALLGLLLSPGQAQARPLTGVPAQEAPVAGEEPLAPSDTIEPVLAPVQIDLGAVISGNLVVYTLYATNITAETLWDLTLKVPLPEGAMLLSAQSSARFVTDYEAGVVSFYAPDLAPNTKSGPQRIHVVVPADADSFVSTHVEAGWKYMDSIMRQSSVFLASAQTSALSMFPGTARQVVADMEGEVPLGHVDLTGVTSQQEGSLYRMDLQLAAPLGPIGETAEYTVYIDSDCNVATGRVREAVGAEHRVLYRHDRGRADLSTWAISPDGRGQWLLTGSIAVNSPAGSQTISLWIPSVLINGASQFCWLAESLQKTPADAPKLPRDRVPNGVVDIGFTRFGNWDEVGAAQSNPFVASAPSADPSASVAGQQPPAAEAPIPAAATAITGKLAIPFANAQGLYDIYLFSMPDGLLLQQIPNAQQPALRADGAQMLATRPTGAGSTLGTVEFDLGNGAEAPSTLTEFSAHPFYSPQGTQLVQERWQSPPAASSSLPGSEEDLAAATLALCDTSVAVQTVGATCLNPTDLQTLLSVDTPDTIHGTHPLWTANGQVVYRGCPAWNGLERCGIYSAPIATAQAGQPSFPTLLTYQRGAFPTDTKDGYFTFTGRENDDWEVYALSLDGTWLVNVSRDRDAQDGLATISPDAHWIAFVSNRGGRWAAWAASLPGGDVHKLFDLPSSGAWETDEHEWVRQRLAWGQ